MNIKVICDRCKKTVDGIKTPDFTGGFYETFAGSYWAKYSNKGENIVCDECMFLTPEYQKDYSFVENIS